MPEIRPQAGRSRWEDGEHLSLAAVCRAPAAAETLQALLERVLAA
jgi:hypothetical protein